MFEQTVDLLFLEGHPLGIGAVKVTFVESLCCEESRCPDAFDELLVPKEWRSVGFLCVGCPRCEALAGYYNKLDEVLLQVCERTRHVLCLPPQKALSLAVAKFQSCDSRIFIQTDMISRFQM